jgi:hypothetical protein
VLLSEIRIEPGTIPPPVLENQTEQLRVVFTANNQIELLFIDSPERQLNRTIRLSYDPQPRVRFFLSTQMPEVAPEA